MFFNILIILYLLILNEHSCSGTKSWCSPETYPVTSDWIFESDALPPANLTQNLTVSDNGTVKLIVFIDDQRDDFKLTLLANPFLKNDSELYPGPELNTSDYNLRQFYTTCEIFKDIRKLPSEISSSPSPAKLTPNQTGSEINLLISNQHGEFDLVLFANPFIRDRPVNGCPPLNTSDHDTRLYYVYCHVSTDEESNNQTFYKIFTGCHYFVMINNQSQRWDSSDFYETSYQYLNTRVTLKDDWNTKPESPYSSMQLKLTFEIPLDCISVLAHLYERPHKSHDLREIKKRKILPDQSCAIKIKGANVSVKCMVIGNITATVSTEGHKKGNKWTAHFTWANLTCGGGHYYLSYSDLGLQECYDEHGQGNLIAWEFIEQPIYVDLGEQQARDDMELPLGGSPRLWIACGLVVSIFIIGVFYWIWMWRRFPGRFCNNNESDGLPLLLSVSTRFVDESETADILLIYQRGYPSVKELETFIKLRLEQKCRGYKIRDVYAPSEFKYVGNVKKWIDEILEAGSKVIWFDTPQLRSRFNDQDKYQTRDDFRDVAATYAFSWVKAQFLDPNTQYRRHFVVRLKGFEVDDRQDDPFQLVSPYARYLLPDQIADLCNHLNSSTESINKNDTNFCRELKLNFIDGFS